MKKVKLPSATLYYLDIPATVEYKGTVCTVVIYGATQDFIFTHDGVSGYFAEELAYWLEFYKDYEKALEKALKNVNTPKDDGENLF